MNLSKARALSPNFGVMEQQSAPTAGISDMLAPMPLPGQMRLWTMQSVAHGADLRQLFPLAHLAHSARRSTGTASTITTTAKTAAWRS